MATDLQCRETSDVIAKFIAHLGKKLPDDITNKLDSLRKEEESDLAKLVYDSMFENQKLAEELNRPSCQDTGVIQFFVKVGTAFPLINELDEVLVQAVLTATKEAPLRHNSVQTFDEVNTGNNVGNRTPSVFTEIVSNNDQLELDVYMAGGGCTLPGRAMVLMPGACLLYTSPSPRD